MSFLKHMGYILNTTDDYHINQLSSLGWELTVSNALQPQDSPCRRALKSNESFGTQLFHFLERFVPFPSMKTVLEVGGGLGYLMRDFLSLSPHLQASMLDISPFLLEKQKETLSGLPVRFIESDFLKMSVSDLKTFDLVILNENLGDFPTLIADRSRSRNENAETLQWVNKIDDFREEFALHFAVDESINIGALCILERLCGTGVPFIFLSEHSCESSMNNPHFPHCKFKAPGTPEKIALKGHNEFTIKFSLLATVAKSFRYKVFRGQYIDILPIDFNDKVTAALRQETALSDDQEIIRQFIYDLHKYEYLVLVHDSRKELKK